MSERGDIIRKSIIKDLNEGVVIVSNDGVVEYVNEAATKILGISEEQLKDKNFARTFIAGHDNDGFIQTVIDSIYDTDVKHYNVVPYNNGNGIRQLYIMTSFLKEGDNRIGVFILFSDITELAELKIEYANSITSLLDSLVKALSTAIDERSPYTANHARNMVRIAEAYLDYLDETRSPDRFDDDRRRAFLMSTWLHDVGKLAVPLEVMDKATRLSDKMDRIEERYEKIRLLDRIALLEGRIFEDEFETLRSRRDNELEQIRRLNQAGFLTDDDIRLVDELSKSSYVNEEGEECRILTDEEIKDLHVRKGTLTDEERAIIQSHVTTTRKILQQVEFPKVFDVVPMWASSHHELLNGTGYPDKLKGSEIPYEVRLLTIIDIYETLTARDRPYKKPIPPEKSLEIIGKMVEEGSIDKEIFDKFVDSLAWKILF